MARAILLDFVKEFAYDIQNAGYIEVENVGDDLSEIYAQMEKYLSQFEKSEKKTKFTIQDTMKYHKLKLDYYYILSSGAFCISYDVTEKLLSD